MITITKNGNAVLFEFEENQHYLYNGTIEVPLNSLSLVTDESEMFTFKKAATNDIFISARYDDVNMSKSQLIDFYIANMVGSTGGGSESGITSGDVESMIEASLQDYYDIDEIDAALSGKADTSAVTESINAAVSGKADTSAVTEAITAAVSGKADSSAVTESINAAVSGKADTSAVTEEISAAVSGKADSTAVTQEISAAISGKADSSSVYTKTEVDTALSGKQDTLIAGDNITISGNVISADGGGKAVSGGTNISITTGETADTINCTLPITVTGSNYYFGANNTVGNYSRISQGFIIGDYNTANGINYSNNAFHYIFGNRNTDYGAFNTIIGAYNTVNNRYPKGTLNSILIGDNNVSSADASYNVSNRILIGSHLLCLSDNEIALGRYNISTGDTKFSIGDGKNNEGKHNAFEIKQNGDIYIVDTNNTSTTDYYQKPMIKLQDALGGGGVSESAFTSYSAATDARISEDEEVTAAALNALNDGKQDTLIAGSGITISGNVISAEGGNNVIELTQAEYDALVDKDPNAFYIITDAQEINISDYYTSAQTQSAINAAVSGKQDTLIAGSGITISGNVISANGGGGSITVDTALDSGSTNPVENRVIYDKFDEVEEVTAAALNALNDKFDGLRLKKLTQAEYEALTVKDNNTLYVIVG